jgi:hypothetical protein
MDLQTTPEAPAQPRRARWPWIALAALLVAVLSVVGYTLYAQSRPLADDPAGAKACSTLADWLAGKLKDPDTGKAVEAIYISETVGKYAAASTTSGIRSNAGKDVMAGDTGELLKSYGAPSSMHFADLETIRIACVTAGMDMPAYDPPSA